jgi:hypothetical protein
MVSSDSSATANNSAALFTTAKSFIVQAPLLYFAFFGIETK